MLGVVSDPFGEVETDVVADYPGLILGRTNLPVVERRRRTVFTSPIVRRHADPEAAMDNLTSQLEEAPLFDEDEII